MDKKDKIAEAVDSHNLSAETAEWAKKMMRKAYNAALIKAKREHARRVWRKYG